MKTCRRCGERKDAGKDFHNAKHTADGKDSLCRPCRNSYVRGKSRRTPYVASDDGPSMADVRRQEAAAEKQRRKDVERLTAAYTDVRPVWRQG